LKENGITRLLTHETGPDQDWKSTLVGTDIFTRKPPVEVEVKKAVKQGDWSHPTKIKTEKI
jgi:hypothetical protein